MREVEDTAPLRELVMPLFPRLLVTLPLPRELLTPLRLSDMVPRGTGLLLRLEEIPELPRDEEFAIAAERLIGLEWVVRDALVAEERLLE